MSDHPPLAPRPGLPPYGWTLPAAQRHEGEDMEPPTYAFSFDTYQPFLVPSVRKALTRG